MNETSPQKRAIIITGPGRSGTSLLTGLLGDAGMRLSPNLGPKSEHNPEGTNEDTEILAIDKRLAERLFFRSIVPEPRDWMSDEAVQDQCKELEALIVQNVAGEGVWGVKDPRISVLISLWIPILNRQKIMPTYFFCWRNPFAIQDSLATQYGMDRESAEMLWLTRTVWFLSGVGARAYIVHYEDWFEKPVLLLSDILRFAGIPRARENTNTIVAARIKNELNRASYERGRFVYPDSEKISALMAEAKGNRPDTRALRQAVHEVKANLTRYPIYHRIVHELIARRRSRE